VPPNFGYLNKLYTPLTMSTCGSTRTAYTDYRLKQIPDTDYSLILCGSLHGRERWELSLQTDCSAISCNLVVPSIAIDYVCGTAIFRNTRLGLDVADLSQSMRVYTTVYSIVLWRQPRVTVCKHCIVRFGYV
jgi:hypothetical protein